MELRHYHTFPYEVADCPGRFYRKTTGFITRGCSLCGIELSIDLQIVRGGKEFVQNERPDQFVLDVARHFRLEVLIIAKSIC